MTKPKTDTITVKGTDIVVLTQRNNEEYISLTDMAGYKDDLEARVVVSNWMSTRFTLEFLGIWEEINNPNFNRMEFHAVNPIKFDGIKPIEFDGIKNQADLLPPPRSSRVSNLHRNQKPQTGQTAPIRGGSISTPLPPPAP